MAEFKVGQRGLWKNKIGSGIIFEATVCEISPSGNWMKFDGGSWNLAEEMELVEELSPFAEYKLVI